MNRLNSDRLRRTLPAAAALLLTGGLCAAASAQEAQAYVTAGSVLRSGPSTRHGVVQRVREDWDAHVFGCTRRGGWCEVQLSEGARGWVAESRLGVPAEDLDHRTSTPLPQRGVANVGSVTFVQPWGYGWGGYGATVIEVAPRGGPGEPAFPMRPGWARGQPMPR
jgi:uncharacterized protein YraI